MSFDTLTYANRLKAAGMVDEQAEAQAEALRDLLEQQMVTNRDLRELELRLRLFIGSAAASVVVLTSAIVSVVVLFG